MRRVRKDGVPVRVGDLVIGGGRPFVFIAGPCVIEDRVGTIRIARRLRDLTRRLGVPFIFKASFDKANRTSLRSFRGPGVEKGLAILREVRETLGVPVTSDVHCVTQVGPAAEVLDVIQIPAFLCRQTDLLRAAAETGRVVNIKKGQFLAPWDMAPAVEKVREAGARGILLTDRGTSFGYNTLVSDFRSLPVLRRTGCPVIFDASHSVQQPGGLGSASGGQREFIPLLARCAVAAGCDGIFLETHPRPEAALSDGPNMWPLARVPALLETLSAVAAAVGRPSGKGGDDVA